MKQRSIKSVFKMSESWRILFILKTKAAQKRQITILAIAIFLPFWAEANVTCKGRFVNPISDICWSCLLPISIGPVSFGKGIAPAKRDTKNPSSPLCACSKGGIYRLQSQA